MSIIDKTATIAVARVQCRHIFAHRRKCTYRMCRADAPPVNLLKPIQTFLCIDIILIETINESQIVRLPQTVMIVGLNIITISS